jgi:hypothetical protein
VTQGFAPPERLRAVICRRASGGAGHGARAFFFTDTYLGTDSSVDSESIGFVSGSDTTITLSYRLFRASDRGCCPSLGSADVRFFWDGGKLVALDPIPTADATKDGHR